MVDLPGLIHATNKAQTEADKELILDIVKEYMKNPRTIILAVVSAKNDFANQIILDHCKKIDEKRERTLGIITKPDYLREGSQNELDWIELAQNRNIYFKLGWHLLKNRADDEMSFSFAQRNQAEELFFNKGRYVDLPRERVGINTLRERLSKLLLNHLIKELPSLKEEMNTKLRDTKKDIEKLGEKRTTIGEQRMLLMRISMEINAILTAAVNGHYKHPFFGSVDMDSAVDSMTNIRRFRAVVQYLNLQFAENMRLRGHQFAIISGEASGQSGFVDEDEDTDDYHPMPQPPTELAGSSDNDAEPGHEEEEDDSLPYPQFLSGDEAIEWVMNIMERSRGNELPGNSNPEIISQLFWEMSKPWKDIANAHIDNVAQACKKFIFLVLWHAAPADFLGRLAALTVDTNLNAALKASREELGRLLDDKARHPMTYNHYFTTTIQKHRHGKYKILAANARAAATKTWTAGKDKRETALLDPDEFQKHMASSIEQDMGKFSSEEALINQRVYYKVS